MVEILQQSGIWLGVAFYVTCGTKASGNRFGADRLAGLCHDAGIEHWMPRMFAWIRRIFCKSRCPSDIDQARQLVRALDRGGIVLNPAKVNAIARDLGLDVKRNAPVEQTIMRIRAYLQRLG